jgi:hypothetical protein
MAKLTAGILSAPSGKIAGVVGGTWKDKSYIRAYVIPANPNTVAQQLQRSAMAAVVAFAKLLVGSVFNPYTDKFQKSMSGFNYFISANIGNFGDVTPWIALKITEGKLYLAGPTNAVYSSPNVTIAVNPATGANGLASDGLMAMVYDLTNEIAYFAEAEVARSTQTITVPCAAGLTATDLVSYVWAVQHKDPDDLESPVVLISNSVADIAEVA